MIINLLGNFNIINKNININEHLKRCNEEILKGDFFKYIKKSYKLWEEMRKLLKIKQHNDKIMKRLYQRLLY
jgi:hypothetical protein